MKIQFVPEARDEFIDAVLYYENIYANLGIRLKEAVDQSVLWIAENHHLYRLRPSGYRRINVRGFPYYIPFIVRNDILWILAIAHTSRKPEYWISRAVIGGR